MNLKYKFLFIIIIGWCIKHKMIKYDIWPFIIKGKHM